MSQPRPGYFSRLKLQPGGNQGRIQYGVPGLIPFLQTIYKATLLTIESTDTFQTSLFGPVRSLW